MSSEQLLFDQANLTITKNTHFALYLWAQTVECFKCDLFKILEVSNSSDSGSVVIPSDKSWNFEIRDHGNKTICSSNRTSFGEHGQYVWYVNDSTCSSIQVQYPPYNEIQPALYSLFIFIASFIIVKLCIIIRRNRAIFIGRLADPVESDVENDFPFPSDVNRLLRPSVQTEQEHRRIKSLDVFRGFSIVLMIFVNYGGGEYRIFRHSPWNGITIADVIFPWFAWIMGVSIAIKIKSELRNSLPKSTILAKIALRSFSLIVLGIILTNLRQDDLNTLRIPGVLQRLGVAYFICSAVELRFMKPQPILQNQRYSIVEDLIESYSQWLIVLVLTSLHLAITFFLPVPGCPTGYLGPGGLYDHSSHYNCTGGAAGYIDRLILTPNHIYQRATCFWVYKCDIPYDPEGLLGILTTTLCVYFGVHAGRIILVYINTSDRIKRWIVWSMFTSLLAGILCGFSNEEGWIPLNKNLWSLSYVLLCCGLAFVLLSFLLYVIDEKKWCGGGPFRQTGMNAILLYAGHVTMKQTFPWQWKEMFGQSTHLENLIMDLWATVLWIVIAVVLYKRKIFFKL